MFGLVGMYIMIFGVTDQQKLRVFFFLITVKTPSVAEFS